ncbi:MAG: helix-turn-helix transcriptional regulator [Azospirillaceae bacterium]
MTDRSTTLSSASAGDLIREWRRRRRLTQLELAADAGISQRHLSFLESGRARPSRGMILRLADELDVPMRERNALLVAAGFAPAYGGRDLADSAMAVPRAAVEQILERQMPHPALAVDRLWNLVAANRAVQVLMADVDAELIRPPLNVLRLSLHPRGLGPRIRNLRAWRHHLFARLERQVEVAADSDLATLLDELREYPLPADARPYRPAGPPDPALIAIPLEVTVGEETLRFLTTTTVFGTALDILLAELTIESLYPADTATAAAMHRLAGDG